MYIFNGLLFYNWRTMQNLDSTLVSMGHIAGPFGVRGWCWAHGDTQYADSLLDYQTWYLGQPEKWRQLAIEDIALNNKGIVVKFVGVDDRDAAFALRGLQIAVARADFPAPAEDEYYWSDLIGLRVENLKGESLGLVKELFATGANDVLVSATAEKEYLMPFVAAIVQKVNLAEKIVIVDWELDY